MSDKFGRKAMQAAASSNAGKISEEHHITNLLVGIVLGRGCQVFIRAPIHYAVGGA